MLHAEDHTDDDLGFAAERAANARRWDELVPLHVGSEFYAGERFAQTRDSLTPIERTTLGTLLGARVLHLQCHFGQDTISLAHRGAQRAVGIDLSKNAVRAAKRLARELGLGKRTKFVHADVLTVEPDDHRALAEPFDIVFASWGVFGWIPDLQLWAAQAARFLRPGGRLVVAEFHPLATALEATRPGEALRVRYPYFCDDGPDREVLPGSYAAPDARLVNDEVYWWAHPFGDMLTAVLRAGLQIDEVRELPRCWHRVFPFTVRDPSGDGYVLPPGMPSLPLSFVLQARRPQP